MSELLPVFLKLRDLPVLVVGAGPVALEKSRALLRAGARLVIVSPSFLSEFDDVPATRVMREFTASDLDGAWFVVAAAPPAVNREVRAAGDAARVFVLSVDDPENASVYGAATLEKGGVTFAISTGGVAPALVRLLREALEHVLPSDLGEWTALATRERKAWRADGIPLDRRRGLLFQALVAMYGGAS